MRRQAWMTTRQPSRACPTAKSRLRWAATVLQQGGALRDGSRRACPRAFQIRFEIRNKLLLLLLLLLLMPWRAHRRRKPSCERSKTCATTSSERLVCMCVCVDQRPVQGHRGWRPNSARPVRTAALTTRRLGDRFRHIMQRNVTKLWARLVSMLGVRSPYRLTKSLRRCSQRSRRAAKRDLASHEPRAIASSERKSCVV